MSVATIAVTFDADAAWRLHPDVAVRPEPFGALVYHYGTRRLTFLKHPALVAVLRCLCDHPTARAAYDAAGVARDDWPRFDAALQRLAETHMLVETDPEETT